MQQGAQSDFNTLIGPLTLTTDSVMEFDGLINAESAFDGGVVEIAVGTPTFNATPFPDNTTTYDLGEYMTQGGYTGKLDGVIAAPALASTLQGRRAFTGTRGLSKTRISLRAFAPGGVRNPNSLQVYIRFRMTSDAGSTAGVNSGWYIDNLVINNLDACPLNQVPIAVLAANPTSGTVPLSVSFDASGSSDPDAGVGDSIVSYTIDFGDGTPVYMGSLPATSHTYTTAGMYTATLTVRDTSGAANTNTNTNRQVITVNAAATPTPTPTGPAIASVELGTTNSGTTQTLVGGCSTDRGLVRLTAPAPNGGQVVQLSSSNSSATVPASVTVAAGQTTAYFFTSTTYTPTTVSGAITGMSGGATASQVLNVRPIKVRSMALSPDTVNGASQTVNGTATLECTAPTTISINLVSSVPSVATVNTSTLTINSGANMATFTATTSAQNKTRATIINATTGGQTTGAKLTVNP